MIHKIIKIFFDYKNIKEDKSIDKAVEYSLQKYKRTYKLLEEYDKESTKDPEDMADSGRLQPVIRKFQKDVRASRTTPAI